MARRNLRRHHSSSSDGEDNDQNLKCLLNDIKDVQKMRKRPPGLNVAELVGTSSESDPSSSKDPFKLKHGGIVDMKKMKHADIKEPGIEEGIKQTFSKESHLRDEDEEMRKYVEEELARRKNGEKNNEPVSDKSLSSTDPVEEILMQLPDHLKRYQSKKTEEMLSNQMLCGIPEVDLGVDAKIRNIEETEAAKLKLLKEAMERKKSLTEKLTARQNLAKDLAKSYVQHNICCSSLHELRSYHLEKRTIYGAIAIFCISENAVCWYLQIYNDPDPVSVKRRASRFSSDKWDHVKEYVMIALDKRKLQENPEVQQFLASSGNKLFAELVNDSYWGIDKIEETTLIGSESERAKPKRPDTQPMPVVDDDTPKWVKDGRTVERPVDAVDKLLVDSEKALRSHSTSKPSDKHVRDSFKEKFVKQKR